MDLDFRPAETFRGTRILRQADGLAYAYETRHAAADADGAPNAYHPDDRGKRPRDPRSNADIADQVAQLIRDTPGIG